MRKFELAQLGCGDMPTGHERCEVDMVTSHTTEELGWDPAAWPPRLPTPWAAFTSIPSASLFLPHFPFTYIHPELVSVFLLFFKSSC